jgi:phage baseplate assembly protein gpV
VINAFGFAFKTGCDRYWKRYFSNWLDWLSSETLQWVFWWMQHVLSQVHLLECFQEKDIR